MEPKFIVEPSYTKEEMRQYSKECWHDFDKTGFLTGYRIVSIVFLIGFNIIELIRFNRIVNPLIFILSIILIVLVILFPKGSALKCVGIGPYDLLFLFHKKIKETVTFYDDHVHCLTFKDIQYRNIEIIERENRLTLQLEKRFFIIKDVDLTLGTYSDLKDFLYLKKQEEQRGT